MSPTHSALLADLFRERDTVLRAITAAMTRSVCADSAAARSIESDEVARLRHQLDLLHVEIGAVVDAMAKEVMRHVEIGAVVDARGER